MNPWVSNFSAVVLCQDLSSSVYTPISQLPPQVIQRSELSAENGAGARIQSVDPLLPRRLERDSRLTLKGLHKLKEARQLGGGI